MKRVMKKPKLKTKSKERKNISNPCEYCQSEICEICSLQKTVVEKK